MPLEIQRGRSKWWYARITINGKKSQRTSAYRLRARPRNFCPTSVTKSSKNPEPRRRRPTRRLGEQDFCTGGSSCAIGLLGINPFKWLPRAGLYTSQVDGAGICSQSDSKCSKQMSRSICIHIGPSQTLRTKHAYLCSCLVGGADRN